MKLVLVPRPHLVPVLWLSLGFFTAMPFTPVEAQRRAAGTLPSLPLASSAAARIGAAGFSERPLADRSPWPEIVGLDGAPEMRTMVDNPQVRSFIYRSKNYDIVADSRLSPQLVRELGRLCEATLLANRLLPLGISPKPERLKNYFTVRIYTHARDYHAAGGPVGSSGMYCRVRKSIQLPLSTLGVRNGNSSRPVYFNDRDHHTLIHEITHQSMNHWLGKLPPWLVEGSAEFVAWADYDLGRFDFGRMDRRIAAKIGRRGVDANRARCLGLRQLMAMDPRDWSKAIGDGGASVNYSTAALLTYYFYLLDGKRDGANIIACFNSIRNGTSSREAISRHLLRGRSPEALERDMTAAFKGEGVSLDFNSSARS
jgi:hypothetical protein